MVASRGRSSLEAIGEQALVWYVVCEVNAMHASEAEFRLRALDVAATPTLIAVAGEHGVDVRYANSAFFGLYGLSADTALSEICAPGRDVFAGPSDRGANHAWRASVRQGRAARVRGVAVNADGAAFQIDMQVQPLDGDERAAALFLRAVSPALVEPQDVDMAMAALDATAEELCMRDAEVELVFQAFPGVIIMVDRALMLRAIGGEGLSDLGVRATPETPCALAEIFPGGAAGALTPLAEGALAGRRARFSFFCAGRSFEGLAAPVRLDHGEVESAMLALHDVTDRNEAYAALAPTTLWPPASSSR